MVPLLIVWKIMVLKICVAGEGCSLGLMVQLDPKLIVPLLMRIGPMCFLMWKQNYEQRGYQITLLAAYIWLRTEEGGKLHVLNSIMSGVEIALSIQ